jgi:NTP pyrophosphatase (non-canonical NTP hydrolase)
MMNFEEYQKRARSTAVYPAQSQIVYPALGLAGEAGEVAELVKKWLRDERSHNVSAERVDKLAAELGDVLWYIANLCTDLGLDLQMVASRNIEKLADRAERGKIRGDGDNR